jgi:hypothetical protein
MVSLHLRSPSPKWFRNPRAKRRWAGTARIQDFNEGVPTTNDTHLCQGFKLASTTDGCKRKINSSLFVPGILAVLPPLFLFGRTMCENRSDSLLAKIVGFATLAGGLSRLSKWHLWIKCPPLPEVAISLRNLLCNMVLRECVMTLAQPLH